MKTVIALLLTAVVLSACASTKIEERGLAKCSGKDRRPLNADLWDHESEKVKQTGIVRTSFLPEDAKGRPAKAIESLILQNAVVLSAFTDEPKTKWNVAGSFINCGDNHG